MRRSTLLVFSTVALVAASSAFAGTVSVPIDQAKVVTFDRPVSTVYVGNPAMADVSVIDPHRVFVLGKAFGTTNLIALDTNGKLLSNDPLKIEGHSQNTVTLNRGPEQFTYACAGARCEASPVPGDASGYYSPVMSENSQRQAMGEHQALAANSSPAQ
jgi:hypothetical protein